VDGIGLATTELRQAAAAAGAGRRSPCDQWNGAGKGAEGTEMDSRVSSGDDADVPPWGLLSVQRLWTTFFCRWCSMQCAKVVEEGRAAV
jgi:hypothetical protein